MTHQLNDAIRFGFLIQDVSRLRRVMIDRLLKPLSITRSQWWLLTFLSRRDGMTQTALAADLDLTKVAVGGLLNRMEVAGLIERRIDENDARRRRVYLTRIGNRLIQQIRDKLEPFESEALGQSTIEELAITLETLRHMKKKLLVMIGDEGSAKANADHDDVGMDEEWVV